MDVDIGNVDGSGCSIRKFDLNFLRYLGTREYNGNVFKIHPRSRILPKFSDFN